jgi:hypothetical protein
MNKKQILICGDSFSTDFNNKDSWVSMLSNKYQVDNLSTAGISEYKILQQVKSKISKLDDYSNILIFHTSPNRVYIKKHPVHARSKTHANSDLIYSDIEYHHKHDLDNPVVKTALEYFLYIFDEDYYLEMYYLIQEKIQQILNNRNVMHFDNFNLANVANLINYIPLSQNLNLRSGQINHYDKHSNHEIFKFIETKL